MLGSSNCLKELSVRAAGIYLNYLINDILLCLISIRPGPASLAASLIRAQFVFNNLAAMPQAPSPPSGLRFTGWITVEDISQFDFE